MSSNSRQSATLKLTALTPFASGGNRLCFVHPEDASVCVKVAHPEVSLADKRKRKGLKGRFKPASAFDENAAERKTLLQLRRRIGPALEEHVPRYLGMVDTDLGPGIQVDLIRSQDGSVALPLKQYLWTQGRTAALDAALETFATYWVAHRVPSRALLLHNVVVQDTGTALKLWVIDGLGNSDLLPLATLSQTLARRKAERKIADLRQRVTTLLRMKATGEDPGRHGFLPAAEAATTAAPAGRD